MPGSAACGVCGICGIRRVRGQGWASRRGRCVPLCSAASLGEGPWLWLCRPAWRVGSGRTVAPCLSCVLAPGPLGGLRTAESAAPAAHSPESSGHGGCLSQAARAEGAPAARLGPHAHQEGPPGPEESPLPCAGHRLLGAAVRRARYSLAPELALGAAQGAWQEGGLPVPSHPSRAVLLVRPGTGTCCFCSPRASLAPLRRWRRRPRWR